MIPWEGLNDMYREVAFHGGIFELELNLQYLDYQSILQKYLEPRNGRNLYQEYRNVKHRCIKLKHHY
jgi:predicted acyl esterase